jgi:hypothetical protein
MKKFKTGRLDANESAQFLRQAEYVMAETYNVIYPQYQALAILPVKNDGGPGARTITYRQFDSVGVAKVVNSYAKDFPRVDIKGKEFSVNVKSLGDSYGYNEQEIREAQFNDLPLETMRAAVAREAMVQKMNKLAWFGETESGLKGLIYHPNVTKSAATTGTWSSATKAQILADVNNAIRGPKILTKGVEYVDTVLLPEAKYGLLATTPYSDNSPVFLLDVLKAGNPGVSFYSVPELADLPTNPRTGATATTQVMVTMRRDPNKVWISIPQDFEQFPPEREGMEWIIYCHARFAGIITPYPLSIQVTDGI